MPRAIVAALAAGCVVVFGAAKVSAADDTIKHIDQHFSGDRVVGDVTMRFIGANPLTQSVKIDVVATTVTPQPLPSGFTNSAPAAAPNPAATPAPKDVKPKATKDVLNPPKRTLHCEKSDEVVLEQDFFLSCADAAVKTADALTKSLDDTLSLPEGWIATFRGESNKVVLSSANINDEVGLRGYRDTAIGLISGNGKAQSVSAIDTAVSAIGVWPKAKADDARAALTRYAALLDKVQNDPLSPDLKSTWKDKLAGRSSSLDDAAATKYEDRRKKLIDSRNLLLGLTAASYVQEVPAACTGLLGKGLERKITVTVTPIGSQTPSVTDDVTTVCLTRSFVSTGFTFVSGGDRTFGTVAPNSATAPVPAPSSPPNTIVETTRSDVHAASISFVNFRVGGNPRSENGIYSSFGVIVGTGGSSTTDFAAGMSYTFARQYVLTLGGFLGSDTKLAPGYTLGGPIAVNVSNPPTTTTRKIRPFVGVSFNL